jgi:dihydroflavonol-4-reductase
MSILVTGGTGFIGSHVVDTLTTKGERVRAFVRRTSDVSFLDELGVERIVGDVQNPESVDRAIEGSDIVLHLATAPDWKPTREHWNTNYYGTLNVLDAALKHGVQRLVHCSTIGVLGFADDTPLTENAPYAPSHYSPYAITKCEAEKVALTYCSKGLPVSIVRPAHVYGPRDTGTMGLAFQWVQRGIFPLIGGGNALFQPIHVRDVVEAIVLAMERETAVGQAYNIAGDVPLSFKAFFSIMTRAFGSHARRVLLPRGIAWALGYLLEKKTQLVGGYSFLTRFRVECATRNMIYNIAKARYELGFIPKLGVEEGVKQTVEYTCAKQQ